MALKGCQKGEKTSIKDFAHIPWEGKPDFPFHPHHSKEIPKQKLVVKVPFGIFQHYVGEILDSEFSVKKWLCQI